MIVSKRFTILGIVILSAHLQLSTSDRTIYLRNLCEKDNRTTSQAICTGLNYTLGADNFEKNLEIPVGNVVLHDSNIPILPSALFYVFPRVRNFTATNCNIKLFTKFSFRGANLLEFCDLSRNDIVEVADYIFQLIPRLKHLNLAQNRIHTIHWNAFAGLLNLEFLHLELNNLRIISYSWLRVLPRLKILHLARNEIQTSIGSYSFKGNPKLQYLDLAYNNIKGVSQDAFNGRSGLRLNLKENKVRKFRSYSLQELDLTGTPVEALTIDGFIQELRTGGENLTDISILEPEFTTYLQITKSPHLDFSFISRMEILEKLSLELENNDKLEKDLLKNLTRLTIIDLAISSIKNLDFRFLERCRNLEWLNLSRTRFSDGITFENVKLPRLITLILNDVQILSFDFDKKSFRYVLPLIDVINIENDNLPCSRLKIIVEFLRRLVFDYEILSRINGIDVSSDLHTFKCRS